jgi:ubiquinone/menaquinone biosynthesis C-methylase UbiE
VFSCTCKNYDVLYARWQKNPADLLTWGGYKPEDNLLDLCGGTGVISRAAKSMGGKKITLLDLNPRCPEVGIRHIKLGAERIGGWIYRNVMYDPEMSGEDKFDFAVCRQAVNYLDLDDVARGLNYVIVPGGKFVFNTYICPRWYFKNYSYAGKEYFELAGYFGNKSFHLQAMFWDWDFTIFTHYTHEEFLKAFTPYFSLEKYETSGNSSRYLWIKNRG